jgi:hypothetical protein
VAKQPIGTCVNPWHDTWQAAALRVQTEAAARGDFARIPEIGRAAMDRTPVHLRTAAMNALYEAYWNNRLDWDIRRLLDDDVHTVEITPLCEAVQHGRQADENHVTVSLDQFALLLDDYQRLRLVERHRQDLAPDG